jgi:HK97 family phage portal protein
MRLLGHMMRPTPQRAGLVELFPTWANQTFEAAPSNFLGMVNQVYKKSGVVSACVSARMMLYSEVRFTFRNLRSKQTFGNSALSILERPWPNGTTGELLSRMEQDASLAGNAFIYKASPTQLQRLRPDLVQVMSNGREVTGYIYYPDGMSGQGQVLLREEVAHYTPLPDPEKNWTGHSWIATALSDIWTDRKMVAHQDKFYSNAATPNLFLKVETNLTDEARTRLRSEFDRRYGGWENAYKTVILDGGADMKAVGLDFKQADYVASRAANELRIAQAAGVPPIIIGLQMGLENASYSNYEQQLKQFATTLRALWRATTDALSNIVDVPAGAELWWDESEVSALQDNAKNRAEIRQMNASTINSLITAGYTAESAERAVTTDDFSVLEHTGLFSVQLQPAGVTASAEEPVFEAIPA